MRRVTIFLFFFMIATFINAATEQDSTGLPGDNFSLEGAMDLFKHAKSPEDFEKQLNNPDNPVNNLDLNEDGEVDYIKVEDITSKDVHALVLRVDLSSSESQDVAVIEIEKTGKKDAIAQIIGDSALYEGNPIVEPFDVEEGMGDTNGPSPSLHVNRIVVNVWLWPSVRFIYAPSYRPWRSPWRWAYYPAWWRPWRPYPWHVYHPRVRVYHVHYRVTPHHRVVHAHKIYTPRRKTSVSVTRRTTIVKTKRRKSGVISSKTKTTTIGVKKKNGKIIAGKQTSTTKTVKSSSGNKKVVKSTTKTKKVSTNKHGKVTRTKTKSKSTSVTHKNKHGGKTKVTRTKTKKVTKKKRK